MKLKLKLLQFYEKILIVYNGKHLLIINCTNYVYHLAAFVPAGIYNLIHGVIYTLEVTLTLYNLEDTYKIINYLN